jgi:hypothetical protein
MLYRLGPWAPAFVLGLMAMLSAPTSPAVANTDLERKESPAESRTYLISPVQGAVITSPVIVRFGLQGMGIAPAGIDKAGTGHHHLLIDTDLPALSLPIPNDAQHRHYGGGQTEAIIELPPGEHSLQLILGDERHIPHDPAVISEKILIQVQ